MSDFILFYVSAEPGAAPFVRVPATPEGLRYAGYFARYRGVPLFRGGLSADHVTDEQQQSYIAGYYGYPTHPGIPIGTERYAGDGVWCRHVVLSGNSSAWAEGWEPVPDGVPAPRSAS